MREPAVQRAHPANLRPLFGGRFQRADLRHAGVQETVQTGRPTVARKDRWLSAIHHFKPPASPEAADLRLQQATPAGWLLRHSFQQRAIPGIGIFECRTTEH